MSVTNRFEDRLLAELRHVVAERAAPSTDVAMPHRRRALRPRLALAGLGAIAAVAGIAGFAVGGGGIASPAYAVESHADGTVDVEISSLRDAGGLEQDLRAAGIPATVHYGAGADDPCPGAPGKVQADPPASGESGGSLVTKQGSAPELKSSPDGAEPLRPGKGTGGGHAVRVMPAETTGLRIAGGEASFTLDRDDLEPGEQVVLTASGDSVDSISVSVAGQGATPACAALPQEGR